tara:strand:+ start:83 stop:295 length:213 start_codon:yes stop_codon:yes gene_type:complete
LFYNPFEKRKNFEKKCERKKGEKERRETPKRRSAFFCTRLNGLHEDTRRRKKRRRDDALKYYVKNDSKSN